MHHHYPVSPTLFQESCYAKFIKDFISTLKLLLTKYKDDRLQKVCKNMEELPRICTKLQVSCLLLGKPETSFFLLPQPGARRAKDFLQPPLATCEALLSNPKEDHSLTGARA